MIGQRIPKKTDDLLLGLKRGTPKKTDDDHIAVKIRMMLSFQFDARPSSHQFSHVKNGFMVHKILG